MPPDYRFYANNVHRVYFTMGRVVTQMFKVGRLTKFAYGEMQVHFKLRRGQFDNMYRVEVNEFMKESRMDYGTLVRESLRSVLSVQIPSIFGDLAVKDGDTNDDGKSNVLKRKHSG